MVIKTGLLIKVKLISVNYIPSPFSSVAQSCPTLCDPMNRSTPGLPVHHQLPEFTQTHIHWVGDAIQPSHPLSSPFTPAWFPSWLNLRGFNERLIIISIVCIPTQMLLQAERHPSVLWKLWIPCCFFFVWTWHLPKPVSTLILGSEGPEDAESTLFQNKLSGNLQKMWCLWNLY